LLRLEDWRHELVLLLLFVDELASHSIRAVAVGTVLLAHLGLVKDGDIGLDHHLGSLMSKGALLKK
jgi:hypothetical protein